MVLPDHMHALWTRPEGDAHFSHRWQASRRRSPKPSPLRNLAKAADTQTLPDPAVQALAVLASEIERIQTVLEQIDEKLVAQ